MAASQKKKDRTKNNISEQEYLRSRDQEEQQIEGNPPESNIGSVAIILEGSCKVVIPDEDFEVLELR